MPAPQIIEEVIETNKGWIVTARFTPASNGGYAVSATADPVPAAEITRAAPLREVAPIQMEQSVAPSLDDGRRRVCDFIAFRDLGNVVAG